MILQTQGDLDGAMRLLKEKEAICRGRDDPAGLVNALAGQAHLLAFAQSRPADALVLAEDAMRLATKHRLSTLVRQIEPLVNQIRGLLK
jgi:hypothetical protein